MTAAAKVLVIGGYGVFGGRLIQLLEDDPRLNLLVPAVRWSVPAHSFAQKATRRPSSRPLRSTATATSRDIWQRSGPTLLSTPAVRSTYGADRYRVVQACVTQRVNYLDLADGSDFVAGIDAFVIH